MSNCCLLQTSNLPTTLKKSLNKSLEMPARKFPALRETAARDVTPASITPIETEFLALTNTVTVSTALVPTTRRDLARVPAIKTKRLSKKSKIQAFVELMLAAGSLLFLAMT